MTIKPPIKWVGSKQQLTDEIRSHFPDGYDTYYEPMFGSGAVFFEERPHTAVVNDYNWRLAEYWSQVKDYPTVLIKHLRGMPDPDSDSSDPPEDKDEYYYTARTNFNDIDKERVESDDYEATVLAALFQYLNRTGYNGLYRENQRGEFNVPIGRYANPDWVQAERVKACSTILNDADATILQGDYADAMSSAGPDDVVYLDPPYKPGPETGDFVEYTGNGFDMDQQKRLLSEAIDVAERGATVVVTQSAAATDLYHYNGFDIHPVTSNSTVSQSTDERGDMEQIIAVR